ncbi:potassium channel family protein [Acetohalobium arabaticum]|uniref:Trk system potassium uptake protein TrkA n=1 Tax=Acetohalobium arabaticum (strain ATCC 49924 / DSM 5501 / Z-7288) TaxID=574087 RepID=D9QQU2_ACEAZ|nr:TrkA family potassium uptake protein [Acetohalobium arabaticum]ADL12883.1 TrkA-N domain protein [Acetohalobium arabaticum DSM 5501]
MRIIIVGGGKVVYHLTKNFTAKGYEVAIINKDKDYCKMLARETNSLAICGDGSKPEYLAQAEARKTDAVLALTGSDPDNLFICQLAQKEFGIPQTFSVVNNPDNEEIFKSLGVETIFNTTKLISLLIEQRVEISDVNNLLSIEEGRISISQVVLKSTSPVLGKTVRELDLPHDIVFGCVIREENVLIPHGDTKLLEGDKVLIITLPEKQGQAFSVLSGE